MRRKKLTHFSHQHPLHETNVKEEDGVVCSCCRANMITGPGFRCKHSECGFLLHKSCFELPQRICHKSHPAHVLTLVSGRKFRCNACGEAGGPGFSYYCSVCDYDVHVKCSSLSETVIESEEHEHPVSLQYSLVRDNDDIEFVCDVCERIVKPGCWVYYCEDCDFGTHLDCVHNVESKEAGQVKADAIEDQSTKANSGSYDKMGLTDLQIRVREQLQLNQMEMQTSILEVQRKQDRQKFLLNLI